MLKLVNPFDILYIQEEYAEIWKAINLKLIYLSGNVYGFDTLTSICELNEILEDEFQE